MDGSTLEESTEEACAQNGKVENGVEGTPGILKKTPRSAPPYSPFNSEKKVTFLF